jgi:hypothetical protein
VRPLHHPACLHGRKALRAGWPGLHCAVPAWTMRSGFVNLLIILPNS